MDSQLRKVLNGVNDDHPKPKSFNLNRGQLFPEKMSFLDYRFDMIETWWPWLKSEDYSIPANTPINDVVVPTKESNCMSHWLDVCISGGLPLMVVGPSSTGKTTTISNYMNNLSSDKYLRNVVNFSVKMSAQQVGGFGSKYYYLL